MKHLVDDVPFLAADFQVSGSFGDVLILLIEKLSVLSVHGPSVVAAREAIKFCPKHLRKEVQDWHISALANPAKNSTSNRLAKKYKDGVFQTQDPGGFFWIESNLVSLVVARMEGLSFVFSYANVWYQGIGRMTFSGVSGDSQLSVFCAGHDRCANQKDCNLQAELWHNFPRRAVTQLSSSKFV